MNTDLYTKGVLTVIAVCLIWLALGGPALLSAVQAQAKTPPGGETWIRGWITADGAHMSFEQNPLPVLSRQR